MSEPAEVVRGDVALRGWVRGVAIVVVTLQIAWSLVPMLLRDDLYSEDAAQHTWWLYRFEDPTLFPNDIAADYISQPTLVPMGYQWLMRAVVPYVDAQRASEALAILLAALGAWLTWRLGDRIGGLVGACAAIIVFVALDLPHELFAGGFPRAFGLPLLLAGVIATLDKRWWLAGLVLLLSVLFYTPIVMNLAPVVGVMWLLSVLPFSRVARDPLDRAASGPAKQGAIQDHLALFALGLIALAILVSLYLKPIDPHIGPWFTYEETKQMPEWNTGGRMKFHQPWRVMYFHLSTSGIGLRLPTFCIVVALLGATVLFFRRAIPLTAWVLIGSALLMWALAHLLLFKLYMPSRYLIYARPVFAMMWAAGLARELYAACHSERTREGSPSSTRATRSFASTLRMTWLGTVLLILAAIGSVWFHSHRRDQTISINEEALDVIRALPKDALIASYPDDANAIPLRTRRSVLVNTELSVAMNKGYYAKQKQRLEATFAMLYSDDWDAIDAIANANGVSYFLIVHDRLLNPKPYWQPFGDQNAAAIARGNFAMLDPPDHRIVFVGYDVTLVRVGAQ